MSRYNFKGWKFVEWLKGNQATIEEAVKVGIPYIASTFVTDVFLQQFLITIVGKFVLDSFHYWMNK